MAYIHSKNKKVHVQMQGHFSLCMQGACKNEYTRLRNNVKYTLLGFHQASPEEIHLVLPDLQNFYLQNQINCHCLTSRATELSWQASIQI